ncbi:MAG: hypothetical protein P1V20_05050 [Verrucomicrobiales bacterium]|nr:hypothetical protein [Verrucomicrobiales bacterium]
MDAGNVSLTVVPYRIERVENIHPLEHAVQNRFQLDLPPDIQFFAMTTMSFVERATNWKYQSASGRLP